MYSAEYPACYNRKPSRSAFLAFHSLYCGRLRIAADVASSEPAEPGREVRCPGMGEHRSRKENMELGIPVAEEKWAEVLAM